MTRTEIRLECLKLAVAKSPDHGEAMTRAKLYFDFCEESQEEKVEVKAQAKLPKPGNAKTR